MDRKHFIQSLGATAVGTALLPQSLAGHPDSNKPPKGKKIPEFIVPTGAGISNSPHNEKYWGPVASNFIKPEGFINLENGYFSLQPLSTLQFHQTKEHDINKRNSWFMRVEQQEAFEKKHKKGLLRKL